jgi:hypothetical protein
MKSIILILLIIGILLITGFIIMMIKKSNKQLKVSNYQLLPNNTPPISNIILQLIQFLISTFKLRFTEFWRLLTTTELIDIGGGNKTYLDPLQLEGLGWQDVISGTELLLGTVTGLSSLVVPPESVTAKLNTDDPYGNYGIDISLRLQPASNLQNNMLPYDLLHKGGKLKILGMERGLCEMPITLKYVDINIFVPIYINNQNIINLMFKNSYIRINDINDFRIRSTCPADDLILTFVQGLIKDKITDLVNSKVGGILGRLLGDIQLPYSFQNIIEILVNQIQTIFNTNWPILCNERYTIGGIDTPLDPLNLTGISDHQIGLGILTGLRKLTILNHYFHMDEDLKLIYITFNLECKGLNHTGGYVIYNGERINLLPITINTFDIKMNLILAYTINNNNISINFTSSLILFSDLVIKIDPYPSLPGLAELFEFFLATTLFIILSDEKITRILQILGIITIPYLPACGPLEVTEAIINTTDILNGQRRNLNDVNFVTELSQVFTIRDNLLPTMNVFMHSGVLGPYFGVSFQLQLDKNDTYDYEIVYYLTTTIPNQNNRIIKTNEMTISGNNGGLSPFIENVYYPKMYFEEDCIPIIRGFRLLLNFRIKISTPGSWRLVVRELEGDPNITQPIKLFNFIVNSSIPFPPHPTPAPIPRPNICISDSECRISGNSCVSTVGNNSAGCVAIRNNRGNITNCTCKNSDDLAPQCIRDSDCGWTSRSTGSNQNTTHSTDKNRGSNNCRLLGSQTLGTRRAWCATPMYSCQNNRQCRGSGATCYPNNGATAGFRCQYKPGSASCACDRPFPANTSQYNIHNPNNYKPIPNL